LAVEDGTDTLSRNVGKGLPLEAVKIPVVQFYSHLLLGTRCFQHVLLAVIACPAVGLRQYLKAEVHENNI
jgi:hypothetical protein